MLRRSLVLLCCCLTAVQAEEPTHKTVYTAFPLAVRIPEALQELQKDFANYCSGECSGRQRGDYLLLDLSGLPTWRAVNEFQFAEFTGDFADIGSSAVYIEPATRVDKKTSWGWYGVYGLLFERQSLPLVRPGAISAFNMPLANELFAFNGISYHLRYKAKCIPITSGRGIVGYDADISTILQSGSVSQDLLTSTKTHVDYFPYPSCEEAKAAVPPYIIFDLVADLDGDGKLDFVYLNNSGGEFPTVYLSSQAGAGELVKRIDINMSC